MKRDLRTWALLLPLLFTATLLITDNPGLGSIQLGMPWKNYPQIYSCYKSRFKGSSCSPVDKSLWFFALQPFPSLHETKTPAYPIVFRYHWRSERFESLEVTSERVPSKVKAYWKEKLEKDLEHRTGNTNFGYGSRQTRILKLSHDEIYEIKRSAILFDDGKGYKLYPLPKVTKDEIRRYGPLVSWGLPHEDDPEKRIDWLLELLERGGFDRDTFLGPFVFTKGKLFFGLYGGFSEGERNFG